MKPAPFVYHRPDTLDEALHLVAEHAGEAKALAGGQSLVPAMNFRLAQPAVVVDLNRVPALAGLEAVAGGGLRLGAMARQRALEHDPTVGRLAPLLAEAMPLVAHPPIRTRGTLGGSLAHADPAAELPAVMLALDATFGVRSRAGARTIAAADFFLGLFTTALANDELVVEATLPPLPPFSGWAVDEVSRRHGDFALAGAAAVVTLDGRGHVGAVRIGLFGVHDCAVRAVNAEGTLAGEAPTNAAIAAAAHAAAWRDASPVGDLHASPHYRRHLTDVLVRRVLARAVERARGA
ncbi:MAG: xanthine dehydrogenase family protein subunit M [Vicinamibacterales bacterium]